MSEVEYVIVGGGIAGMSIGYHLSERSANVVLLEQGEVGAETTAKSFALFGMWGDETQYSLKRYALDLYNRFAREGEETIPYERIGHFSAATTEEVAEKFEAAIEGEDRDAGIFTTGTDRPKVEYLGPDEIHETTFFPRLDTSEIIGCVYRPEVGYFDPSALTDAFASRARANGVDVREGAHVSEIRTENGRATGVVVDGERLDAETVILAAGPWTPRLASTAGVDLPVRHSLAPVMVLRPAEGLPQTMPSFKHHETNFNVRGNAADGTVYVGNHAGGYEDGEQIDPDEVPTRFPSGLRDEAWNFIDRFLPSLSDASIEDEWVGVRSLTPDGNPLVGRPSVEGLTVVGFNTSGIQLAPGIGRIIAAQEEDGTPTEYYDSLSLGRFDGFDERRP